MSRRNPRGATAAKRRKKLHDARTSRREYRASSFWKAMADFNSGFYRGLNEVLSRYASGPKP